MVSGVRNFIFWLTYFLYFILTSSLTVDNQDDFSALREFSLWV